MDFLEVFLRCSPKTPFCNSQNIGTFWAVTKTALKPAYLRDILSYQISTLTGTCQEHAHQPPKNSPMPKKSLTPIASQPITYRGTTQALKHWSRDLNIPYHTLVMRYKRGDRDAHLLRPVHTPQDEQPYYQSPNTVHFEFNGKVRSLAQWASIFNIGFDTAYKRYTSGITNFYDIFGIEGVNPHT